MSTLDYPEVVIAKGDGIGPEITDATLRILDAAGARYKPTFIDIGEKVYLAGNTSGIPQDAWDSLIRAGVFLKAPITTPQGGGYKSLNVTIRKTMGLYANVRPCFTLKPYIPSPFPDMDMVIVRENEEDLYAGIEHRQTTDAFQCLKLITIPGTQRIVRYAFEYARQNKRKKVTCMVKDNIMKLTDGLFADIFREIGTEYPEIDQEVMIIDIGSARLARYPDRFDVVVTLNLYGDIISDIAAEVSGSVGLCGSSNIGTELAMFEAIHGSAPDIAGKGIANPSGMLNGALMMLEHLGQNDIAERIRWAWLKTLEDGLHTADIFKAESSVRKVGTAEFADAVIERLALAPQTSLTSGSVVSTKPIETLPYVRKSVKKELLGVDVFLEWPGDKPSELGALVEAAVKPPFKLKMITNRGVKVYPDGFEQTFCSDHWRCRLLTINGQSPERNSIPAVLQQFLDSGLEVVKTENLYSFDGERGYSLGQGE
jgi:isocitrate dehydrogenase